MAQGTAPANQSTLLPLGELRKMQKFFRYD